MATPQQGQRGQRRRDSDRFWKERRRALIEEARRSSTLELRDGREFVVLRLASQSSLPSWP